MFDLNMIIGTYKIHTISLLASFWGASGICQSGLCQDLVFWISERMGVYWCASLQWQYVSLVCFPSNISFSVGSWLWQGKYASFSYFVYFWVCLESQVLEINLIHEWNSMFEMLWSWIDFKILLDLSCVVKYPLKFGLIWFSLVYPPYLHKVLNKIYSIHRLDLPNLICE